MYVRIINVQTGNHTPTHISGSSIFFSYSPRLCAAFVDPHARLCGINFFILFSAREVRGLRPTRVSVVAKYFLFSARDVHGVHPGS